MGYYHLRENEHLAFPQELRDAVIKARLKSRSKHKDYDDDQYVWVVYYSEYVGNRKMAFPSLCQYYKFRAQSEWSADIEGPHKKVAPWNKDLGEVDYWKTIRECVESFGLKFDENRLSPWNNQL